MKLIYSGEVIPEDKYCVYEGLDRPMCGEEVYKEASLYFFCPKCAENGSTLYMSIGLKEGDVLVHHRSVKISMCRCTQLIEIGA